MRVFVLIWLFLSLIKLISAYPVPIVVNDGSDSDNDSYINSNYMNCSPTAPNGSKCTFRMAWQYAKELVMSEPSTNETEITFLSSIEQIEMELNTYGSLELVNGMIVTVNGTRQASDQPVVLTVASNLIVSNPYENGVQYPLFKWIPIDVNMTAELVLSDIAVENIKGSMNLEGAVLQTARGDSAGYLTLRVYRSRFVGNIGSYGGVFSIAKCTSNSTNCVIAESLFQDNYAYRHGGSINLDSSNNGLVIRKSVFLRNQAGYGDGIGYGGAIQVYNSNTNITVIDSRFDECSATGAGAISLYQYNHRFRVSATNFTDCSSVNGGGAMTFTEFNHGVTVDSVYGRRCSSELYGGFALIYKSNTNCTVSNSHFKSCNVTKPASIESKAYGGTFSLYENNDYFNMMNTVIENSLSEQVGGAIHIYDHNNYLSFSSIIIRYCNALEGGAIMLQGFNDYVIIENSLFDGNKALGLGAGVLSFESNNHMKIRDNVFTNNRADPGDGGALYLYTVHIDIHISNCYFYNNHANGAGGCLLASTACVLELLNSTFERCYAHDGAAIYTSDYNIVSMNDTRFWNNEAFAEGGSIYFGRENFVVMHYIDFKNTTAVSGGAIMVDGFYNYLFMENSRIENAFVQGDGGAICMYSQLRALVIKNVAFLNTTAKSGGGTMFVGSGVSFKPDPSEIGKKIFQYYSHNHEISSKLLEYDAMTEFSFVINNCTIEQSAGISGGGFFVGNYNSHMLFVSIQFRAVLSQDFGGAFYFSSGISNVVMDSLYITEALSISQGGAVYFGGDNNNLVFKNSVFRGSSAENYGGALYFRNDITDVSIESCKFLYNEVISGDGGAIYFYGLSKSIHIIDCTFIGNKAFATGGAIVVNQQVLDVVLSRSLFSDNSAHKYGGAVYFGQNIGYSNNRPLSPFAISRDDYDNEDYSFISDCIFTSNSLLKSGVRDIQELVDESYCSEQDSSGGAIYADSNNIIVVIDSSISGSNATVGGGIGANTYNWIYVVRTRVFKNYAVRSGGGLGLIPIVTSLFVNIESGNAALLENSDFFSNSADEMGGAIANNGLYGIIEVNGDVNIYNNRASRYGGAIVFNFNFRLVVRNTGTPLQPIDAKLNIYNNVAEFGSAIAMDAYGTENNFTVPPLSPASEQFGSIVISTNKATKGCTMYWHYDGQYFQAAQSTAPYELNLLLESDKISFVDNIAPYGVEVGTNAVTLETTKTIDVESYTKYLTPGINATLFDFYGQEVISDSNSTMTVSGGAIIDCYTISNPGIVKIVQSQSVHGTFYEPYVQVVCYPNGNLSLLLRVTPTTFVPQDHEEISDFEFTNSTAHFAPFHPTADVDLHFRQCKSGEFIVDGTCKLCPEGSYSLVFDPSENEDGSNTCNDCPSEASNCTGKSIDLLQGFWRRTPETSYIFSCLYDGCDGGTGTGDDSCSNGYEGPLCAVCQQGYFYYYFSCISCSNTGLLSGGLVIILILFFFSIVLYTFWISDLKKDIWLQVFGVDENGVIVEDILPDDERHYSSKIVCFAAFIKSHSYWIGDKIKILIATFQVIATASYSFDTSLPASISQILVLFNIFNLSFGTLFPVDCWFHYDFIDSLFVDTLTPLAVSVMLYIAYQIERFHHIQREEFGSDAARYIRKQKSIKNKYLTLFFLLTYLVLPYVTTKIFQTFQCRDVDPDNEDDDTYDYYMTQDMSISCQTKRYQNACYYAMFMILIYPIGVPCLDLALLITVKDDIRSRILRKMDFDGNRESDSQMQKIITLSRHQNEMKSKRNLSFDHDRAFEANSYLPNFLRPVMRRFRHKLRKFVTSHSIRFLYNPYLSKYWYWEIIETYRRIFLTAVISVVATGTGGQAIGAMLLSLAFIKLYSFFSPYVSRNNSILAEVCQFIIFFTFLLLLIVENNILGEVYIDTFAIILLLSIIVIVIWVISLIVIRYKAFEKSQLSLGEMRLTLAVNSRGSHIKGNPIHAYNEDEDEDEEQKDISPIHKNVNLSNDEIESQNRRNENPTNDVDWSQRSSIVELQEIKSCK
jgi:hypothetical protein